MKSLQHAGQAPNDGRLHVNIFLCLLIEVITANNIFYK